MINENLVHINILEILNKNWTHGFKNSTFTISKLNTIALNIVTYPTFHTKKF